MLSLASNISSIQAVEAKYSASFDGAGDFISTRQTFQSTFRGSFTFSFWAKPNDGRPSVFENFFGSNEADEDQIQAEVRPGGQLRFTLEANNESAIFLTNSQVFSDGAATSWTHILISITKNSSANTSVVIYVNGNPITTTDTGSLTDTNHGAFTTTRPFYIGAKNQKGSVNSPLDGGIDEFAIFNAALDATNAAAIYNGGSPLNLIFNQGNYNTSGNLVAYYKMGNGLFDNKAGGEIFNQKDLSGTTSITSGDATFSSNTP